MKFSNELTKYNVNVAIHICRRLHDIPSNERSQAWCSAVAKPSFLSQRVYEKDQQKGDIFVDS